LFVKSANQYLQVLVGSTTFLLRSTKIGLLHLGAIIKYLNNGNLIQRMEHMNLLCEDKF
jgi:hypothetical protein